MGRYLNSKWPKLPRSWMSFKISNTISKSTSSKCSILICTETNKCKCNNNITMAKDQVRWDSTLLRTSTAWVCLWVGNKWALTKIIDIAQASITSRWFNRAATTSLPPILQWLWDLSQCPLLCLLNKCSSSSKASFSLSTSCSNSNN